MSVSFDDLPGAIVSLSEYKKWVCWQEEERNGKTTKVPLQVKTLRRAAVGNEEHYATYTEACARLNDDRVTGVGFVIDDASPFTCIDLDWKGQVNRPHLMPLWARKIVRFFRSYTEWSPSGYGVHIWVFGKIPPETGNRKDGVEIYSRGRYMTVTGARVPLVEQTLHIEDEEVVEGWDTEEIEECEDVLATFHKDLFPGQGQRTRWETKTAAPVEVPEIQRDMVDPPWSSVWTLTDALAILNQVSGKAPLPEDKIKAACEDRDFKAIWDRKPTQDMRRKLGEDHSAWDLALCNRLFDMELDWEELLATLRYYRNRHVGDGKADRMDYWARTISRCSSSRGHVAKVQKAAADIRHLQGITSIVPQTDHDEVALRNEALATFNELWPSDQGRLKDIYFWPLSDRVRITFVDGRCDYCRMADLISFAYWRRMLARVQQVSPPFKQKAWNDLHPCFFAILEKQDDEEFALAHQGEDILRNWASHHSGFEKPAMENLHGNGPWIQGGKICFRLREVHAKCMGSLAHRDVTDRMLAIILDAAGCKPWRVVVKSEGKTYFGPRGVYKVMDEELNRRLMNSLWTPDYGEENEEASRIRSPGDGEDH